MRMDSMSVLSGWGGALMGATPVCVGVPVTRSVEGTQDGGEVRIDEPDRRR